MPEAEENESVLLGGKSTLSPIESPHSLKLIANLPLKNGGWETIFSFWGSANFQVRNASLREGTVTCHRFPPLFRDLDPFYVAFWPPRILQLNFPDGEHGASNELGAGDAQRL